MVTGHFGTKTYTGKIFCADVYFFQKLRETMLLILFVMIFESKQEEVILNMLYLVKEEK